MTHGRVLIALVGVAALSCASAQRPADDFRSYWTEFRRAVLADDMPKVLSMTRFPLELRGPTDDDPVERISREDFPATFRRLLQQDAGMRAEPETLRAYIERTATGREAKGTARVGDLAFEQVQGRWWLVRMYRAE